MGPDVAAGLFWAWDLCRRLEARVLRHDRVRRRVLPRDMDAGGTAPSFRVWVHLVHAARHPPLAAALALALRRPAGLRGGHVVGQYAALLKGVLEGHVGRPCVSGRAFVWNDRRVINFLRILVRLISNGPESESSLPA